MNGTQPTRCAIWARVSSEEQENENQLHELRDWAARRGLEVVEEFVTEDSAWQNGNGTKGKRFDAAREALLEGARRGRYQVVLIWALDRLTRRGMEDMLATVRRFLEHECLIWSLRESFMEELRDPRAKVLFTGLSGWNAEGESGRKSERIRAGMARVKREIEAQLAAGETPTKKIGGREPGKKDKRRRDSEGYEASWKPGGAMREARERLARTCICQDPECGREFMSTATTEQKFCLRAHGKRYERMVQAVKDAQFTLDLLEAGAGPEISAEQERVARARAASPEASWSEVAAGLGMSREQAINHHRLMMMKVAALREEIAAREAAARLVAEASPDMRAVMLAEINRFASG
jgi:putative DNA-invertase from lambdoid prophage Rac